MCKKPNDVPKLHCDVPKVPKDLRKLPNDVLVEELLKHEWKPKTEAFDFLKQIDLDEEQFAMKHEKEGYLRQINEQGLGKCFV